METDNAPSPSPNQAPLSVQQQIELARQRLQAAREARSTGRVFIAGSVAPRNAVTGFDLLIG